MIKEYYTLAKPGIIYGNIFTTVASFLFAAEWHFSLALLGVMLATVFGIGLVIASGCVFNNYIDRHIDAKMERTRNRALVTGTISIRNALIYGAVLGTTGFMLLLLYVNLLSAAVAAVGFIFYVVFYSIAKRWSHWGAVVGSVSGAVPIVVGYAAVTNQVDLGALLLFLVLVVWQMPHFYAIALYRLEEYKAAGIPVLPAEKGSLVTKRHIVVYIAAFVLVVASFGIFGRASFISLSVILVLSVAWFWFALKGFTAIEEAKWAKKTFLFSLIVLVTFCLTISLAPLFS